MKYDVFISYRSSDVHIVRPIAEQLMACGLKVWFAEYKILLSSREQFRKAIDQGLSHCSYGICFTNDRYAGSTYCLMELRRLLHTLGPGRIVEIRCPPESRTFMKFETLGNAHRFEYRNLFQALRDIQSATGYDTNPSAVPPTAAEDRHRLSSHGLKYHLDFGGWEVHKHWFRFLGGADRRIVTYRRSWNGHTIHGHLIAGPMDVVRRPPVSGDADDDDRKYYERALKFAESYYQTHPHHIPVGVHLLFAPESTSQAAITTQAAPGVISRLYSIVIPSSQNKGDIELAFFFFYKGQINGFYKQAYLMDHLVHSLRIENQTARRIGRTRPMRYKMLTILNQLLSFGQAGPSFLSRWLNGQLGKAVLNQDLNRVMDLLNLGVNPNVVTIPAFNAKGEKILGTPLMVAASEGLELFVDILLDNEAEVNLTDSRGWTALLFAAENGYKEICERLLEKGADPNLRTAQRGSALMAAAIKGHAEIVRLLLDKGADPSFRDSNGRSALDFAHKYSRSEIISILEGK